MLRFYVSSTTEDLKEFREAAAEVIRRAGHMAVYMDEYSAGNQSPVDKVLGDVARSDVYVGVFAWRYGHIPTGQEYSVTELEYRKAKELGKPILIFILNEDALWPTKYQDDDKRNIKRFRSELLDQRKHTVCLFSDKTGFLLAAPQAVTDISAKLAVIPTEFPKAEFVSRSVFGIERLPKTSKNVFGRDAELKRLDDAWTNAKTRIACLIGFGGSGKSTLLNRWLMPFVEREDHGGADRIFYWSFYGDQAEQREATADAFAEAVFRWLQISDKPQHPLSCAELLADQLVSRKTLLVLDGFENLQVRHGPDTGTISDPMIEALLKRLAIVNNGLCVILSRLPVQTLGTFVGTMVEEITLSPLPESAGVELLRNLGVKGTDTEMRQAVREYAGHAFSLQAVGHLLVRYFKGDAAKRHQLPSDGRSTADRATDIGPVMEWYSQCLGDGAEVEILKLLSVFNRPAPLGALRELCVPPVIAGLTDHVCPQDEIEWNSAVYSLTQLELVAEKRRGDDQSEGDESNQLLDYEQEEYLDTHAMVRQYFARRLRQQHPQAWIEANRRLYDYYRGLVNECREPADYTYEDLAPLFQAVAHGCEAGLHREAWDQVVWPKIRQGYDGHSVTTLGLWTADLASFSHFFAKAWTHPVPSLDAKAQADLFTESAFSLRGLGRLNESIPVFQAGLSMDKKLALWSPAANAAGNLAEVHTLTGDLSQAKADAEESIEFAMKAQASATNDGDANEAGTTLALNIATLAEVLHQAGDLEGSLRQFEKAEPILVSFNPKMPQLIRARGYHYCDLLLQLERIEEVERRAEVSFQYDNDAGKKGYGKGLAKLLMARCGLVRRSQTGANTLPQTLKIAQEATQYLRQAGHQPYVVLSKFVLASVYRELSDFDEASRLLVEATEVAAQCAMRLLLADAMMEEVRLLHARGEARLAREKLSQVTHLVQSRQYRRRFDELALLKQQLG